MTEPIRWPIFRPEGGLPFSKSIKIYIPTLVFLPGSLFIAIHLIFITRGIIDLLSCFEVCVHLSYRFMAKSIIPLATSWYLIRSLSGKVGSCVSEWHQVMSGESEQLACSCLHLMSLWCGHRQAFEGVW